MSSFVGIQIVAPKKDVYSPVKTYESQLLSTSDSLIEKDRGEVSSSDVPHSTKGALPLVVKSGIIDSRTRGALQLADINQTHVVLLGNQFYRIFENQQEQFTYYTSDDEDYMLGDYKYTSNLVPPDGWSECDGGTLSRTTYLDYFNLVGTSFGSGDGSTTFNKPNFKGGRTPMHKDTGVAAFDTLGETGGASTQTLSAANHAVHTHVQNSHTHQIEDPGFLCGVQDKTISSGPTGSYGRYSGGSVLRAASATATNQNQGSASSFSIQNPYQVGGIWIVKITN